MSPASATVLVSLLSVLASTVLGCQDSVGVHNTLRRQHGDVRGLSWDASLASRAQTTARNLAQNGCSITTASGGSFWRCTGRNCGSCTQAVEQWYTRGSGAYRFGTDRPYTDNRATSGQWADFAQLLWASTSKVGCALARGRNCAVAVCLYDRGTEATNAAHKQNLLPKTATTQPIAATPSPRPSPMPSPVPSPVPSPIPSPAPSPVPSPTPSPVPSPVVGDPAESGPVDLLRECSLWAVPEGECNFGEPVRGSGPLYRFEYRLIKDWCPVACAPFLPQPSPSPSPAPPTDKRADCQELKRLAGGCGRPGFETLFPDPATGESKSLYELCPVTCPRDPLVGAVARKLLL